MRCDTIGHTSKTYNFKIYTRASLPNSPPCFGPSAILVIKDNSPIMFLNYEASR